MTTLSQSPYQDREIEPFELTPELRQRLLENAASSGIDPITNRGCSAAREILSFMLGFDVRALGADGQPLSVEEHIGNQVAFFVDNPQHIKRFGMSDELLQDVQNRLQI